MSRWGDWLNYGWRVLATGWCFLSFSLGGLLLTVTVFPLIRLRWRDPDQRRDKTQRVIHHTFRFFIGQMCWLGVMSTELHGAQHLSQLNGELVFANHPTLIDVVLMISLMPRADCVVKESLWRHKGFGGVIRAAGYVPNRDPTQLVTACQAQLTKGRPLIIFPEGTRTEPGQPLIFQRGAAHMVLAARAPVRPVLLTCEPPALTKGKRWYQIPPRRFHVTLRVLPPVPFEQWGVATDSPPLAARQLTRAMQQFFTQHLINPQCLTPHHQHSSGTPCKT